MVKYFCILLLAGCASSLPSDMAVTVTTYSDPQKLQQACGMPVEACVFTNLTTYCDMHLPEAANGEYIMDAYWHEELHCAGHNPYLLVRP